MIEAAIVLALVTLIAGCSLYNRKKLRRRRQQKAQRGIDQLSALLDLIQQLQRHRGMCANLTDSNRNEQQQLSHQIENFWAPLNEESYGGNKKRISLQYDEWQKIKGTPENSFMAHCELIEKLLHELTVIADGCSLTATNNGHNNQDLWQNLLLRPQYAESLARVRGLGNKAASLGHCPAAVRVQLQYLLLQMDENPVGSLQQKQIAELVREEILEPSNIQIEPRVYFARLTQAIDEQIQQTLNHLHQLS